MQVTGGQFRAGVDMSDGKWHHVAGVYDGSKLCVYVDGKLGASLGASGSISQNNYRVAIGANLQPTPEDPCNFRVWKDYIDDVRIYDYTLSPKEIIS